MEPTSPILQRALDGSMTFGEASSFIAAATDTPITVGNAWTTIGGLTAGPQNYEVADPDLVVADDGASVTCTRDAIYALSINCHFVSVTADGWFEAAVEPIGECTPMWPTDVNKGHVGVWVPAAVFSYADATPGFATTVVAPLTAGDAITATAKYVTATGTDSIVVSGIVFAIRLSP